MLQGKSTVSKTNDENVVPKVLNVKPVNDTYKAFVSVTSTTVDISSQITDENRPPLKDEVDHIAANCSFTGVRFVYTFSYLFCAFSLSLFLMTNQFMCLMKCKPNFVEQIYHVCALLKLLLSSRY